jgi:hypothetical protein
MQSRTASEEPCGARWRSGSVPHFGRTALLLGVNLSDGRLRHQTRANTEGPAFVPITNFGVRPRVPRPPNTRTGRERPFRSRSPRPVVYWGHCLLAVRARLIELSGSIIPDVAERSRASGRTRFRLIAHRGGPNADLPSIRGRHAPTRRPLRPGFHRRAGAVLGHGSRPSRASRPLPEPPSWTGRWFSPSGDRWWRVWACPDHLDGLTGLREFGRAKGRQLH